MLREAKDARFERRLTPLGRRYAFLPGRGPVPGARWGARRFRALWADQALEPVPLAADGDRVWWAFEERVWWEDDALTAHDVLALVRERERRRERRLERAHAALAGDRDPGPQRIAIPREVRRLVWERDDGRCTTCGSAFDLQYDHVIPVALGGAGTAENLQVLCGDCNRRKGAGVG